MAPNPDAQAMKRSSSEAGLDGPESTKQRRRYYRQHSLRWRQEAEGSPCCDLQDEEGFNTQLIRAISLVLQAVGFDYADAPAMESLRLITQEYMNHFLSLVRQSMFASRRTQPTPHDFLGALNAHSLTLTSLLPHLSPPVPGDKSQPTLLAPSAVDSLLTSSLASTFLSDPSAPASYIPEGLPALPSRHTYKADPVYTRREIDPKKVRERAAEESRLGEEALRRLVSSRSKAEMHSDGAKGGKGARQRGRELWMETMAVELKKEREEKERQRKERGEHGITANSAEEQGLGFEEYSIRVNADSIYWRKPATGTGNTGKKAGEG